MIESLDVNKYVDGTRIPKIYVSNSPEEMDTEEPLACKGSPQLLEAILIPFPLP